MVFSMQIHTQEISLSVRTQRQATFFKLLPPLLSCGNDSFHLTLLLVPFVDLLGGFT
jgi:hypothetical protein